MFICLSDTHGSFPVIDRIRSWAAAGSVQAILHAGDLSDFGRFWEPLAEAVIELPIPFYYVSGNHEMPEILRLLNRLPNIHCLDGHMIMQGNVLLAGIAGHDLYRDEMARARRLAFLSASMGDSPSAAYRIMLSHEPPYPWNYRGRLCGSEAVRNAALSFKADLILTGHMHEKTPRLERLDGCDCESWVLNPGNQGCLVRLPADPAQPPEIIHGDRDDRV